MTRLLTPQSLGFLALFLLAAACPPGLAYGASLTGTDRQVAGGFTAVAGCGTMSAAQVGWTVQNTTAVLAAEVSGLPAGCNGATASITFTNSSNVDIASQSGVTVAAGSAVFSTLSATPDPADIVNVHFSVNGP